MLSGPFVIPLMPWFVGDYMRPKQQAKARHDDLFRARLDQIINMKHELVVLADMRTAAQ